VCRLPTPAITLCLAGPSIDQPKAPLQGNLGRRRILAAAALSGRASAVRDTQTCLISLPIKSWRDCHGYSAPAPNEHRDPGQQLVSVTGDQLEASKDLEGTEDMDDAEEAEDRDGHGNVKRADSETRRSDSEGEPGLKMKTSPDRLM
jgi:hypothetical protein